MLKNKNFVIMSSENSDDSDSENYIEAQTCAEKSYSEETHEIFEPFSS